MTKRLTKLVAVALMLTMVCGVFAACTDPNAGKYDATTVTYNSTTTVMPSNWNELTYQDNNDTQILGYISSSFFDYDYEFEGGKKYNEDGSINKEGIVVGSYTTNYSAATKLEDVTATVDAKWGYTEAQKAKGGYAWKITLRDDLKWHDGTSITAEDFLYSMAQTLDPEFMNYRANTYYDTLMIKRAKAYFNKNLAETYESVASFGYESNADALAAGEPVYVDVHSFYGAKGYIDANGNECPQWLPLTDETVYSIDGSSAAEADAFSAAALLAAYGSYLEVGGSYATCVGIRVVNEDRDVEFEDVGMYVVEGENAFVICLDKAYAFLKEDGSLSYLAAYYMSSLPLVHKGLYEQCKQEPATGATLWTSNYNSSLATTASWGPYMLVQFEAGSHFKLAKNPYWYGWNMEQYEGQYNIEYIYTRKVAETTTQWMGFLAGEYDASGLSTDNYEEYKDSKYVEFAGSTGTFGMQLFSDLKVLKESENNNGILAIPEFRQAFNLSLDRSDIVETIYPGSSAPCFGLMNTYYYYDVENSASLEDKGIYRNNAVAKAGVLRAYGYTQAADGTWSINEQSGLTLEAAYEGLTGYNPTLAKVKVQQAIEILNANAEDYGYDSSKDITIVYGSSADTAKQRERCDYLQGVIDTLVAGTALEGKVKLVFDASAGNQWATAFRTGATQIGFGYGFSGNALNPFDIVGAFVNPDDTLNYHTYWDTSSEKMTLTMPEGDYEGAGETIEMSIQNWYFCLNGLAEKEKQTHQYNWDAGYAPVEARLMILSALEEKTIEKSYSVMLIADNGGSMLGAKFSHFFTEEDNVFMGFGGIRYMEVNYNDGQWAKFVDDNGGDLSTEYKKSE